ncbi:MAG: transglutaminase family protein [Candidatus Eremiobacteraeota bacterium]|nr:transglutaminase family protein [Candidatus Eremiobacteraeota bacterium]
MPDDRVANVTYLLRQRFRYDYPGPITHLRHRLVIAPPLAYGDQLVVRDRLVVTPDTAVRWERDDFGNAVATLIASCIDESIDLDYEAVIRRSEGQHPHVCAGWYDDPLLLRPSMLTSADEALCDAAGALRREHDADRYALASRINAFVFDHMRYMPDVTNVGTTASEAFAQGTGVCQDYAHIMLALCRLSGIAARYVSGHLIGEGGTHAWVEVIGEPLGDGTAPVWGFDPTHRRTTTLNYVFVAAGRDFTDVTPTSGCFVAPYIGKFSTYRSVEVVADEDAA